MSDEYEGGEEPGYDEPITASQKTPLALFLQAFLADVDSKKMFPQINKDYAYTRLDKQQIEMMMMRFQLYDVVVSQILKLHKHKNPTDKSTPVQILGKYTAPRMILAMNASMAVLSQSRDGWARELAQTQKFISRNEERKKKAFGLFQRNKKESEF